jgi:hypothetical protein
MTTRSIFKRTVLSLTAVVAVAVASTPARAQSEKDKAAFNKSMASLMGGFAGLVNAESNALKATGAYLEKLVAIQQLQEQVRKLRMENDMQEAKNWYAKKKLYQDYRKANQPSRLTAKKLAELAHNKAPVRLTAAEIYRSSSEVSWPPLLERECFDQKRAELERLMAERTPADSGIGSQNCAQVQQAVGQMKDLLKDRIDETNPMDYVATKKFLDSLAYEARFVATPPIESVAMSK